MMDEVEKMLTTKEAAKRLGITEQTLRLWTQKKKVNLPYVKMGVAIRYRLSDIDDFINRSIVNNEVSTKEK
jgi:excisionase family DNA binding protein